MNGFKRLFHFPVTYLVGLAICAGLMVWSDGNASGIAHEMARIERGGAQWDALSAQFVPIAVLGTLSLVVGGITLVAFILHTLVRISRRKPNVLS